MAKLACLDDEDRRILAETKLKLDEATKLMTELMETIEILVKVGKTLKLGESRNCVAF